MNTTDTILICTVGGSHQPIVQAIADLQPVFVQFICTDKDPATGRPGSNTQITGKGNCIKAQPQDDKPSLPAIPHQTGLTPDQYALTTTSADDLDQIYIDCTQAINSLRRQFPDAHIVADYTGGTKSMSAGLVLAALDDPQIELQLVTGSRSNLVKVTDGAQSSTDATIEQIRFQRQLEPYRQCWQRYAYSEAAAGLNQMKAPRNPQLRGEFNRFRDISKAFALWDNFNHQDAVTLLQDYAAKLPASMKPYIATGMRLNDHNAQKREAAQLYDLYLNALRRAHQQRFDDAVARIYRLIEWSAQWILKHQCRIDTASIKENDIPEGIALTKNREGDYQAGLYAAWQLVKIKTDGAASRFMQQHGNTMLNLIKIRNQSILAHGYTPIGAEHWNEMQNFMQSAFIPMLLQETDSIGIKQCPEQLPHHYNETES